MGNIYSTISNAIKFIDKYGVFKLVKTCFVMVFLSYMTYLTCNPEVIFEKYKTFDRRIHEQSFKKRMESSSLVKSYLDQMLLETGGMRCFVIELHNGTCNSGGLSFNYGSLTYESDKDGAESIMEDYDDFSLERFPFVLHMWKHTTWCGNMTDMCSIDNKMALRLQSNGVDYLYATTIYGKDEILGFLGVTFAEGDYVDINKVRMASGKYASKLSILLDGVK